MPGVGVMASQKPVKAEGFLEIDYLKMETMETKLIATC